MEKFNPNFREVSYQIVPLKNILISVISFVLVFLGIVLLQIFINLDFSSLMILSVLFMFLYVIFMIFLIIPRKVRRKVRKEFFDNKEFILSSIKDEINSPEKFNKPANYVGSVKSGTYHLASCRIAKNIKNEFKIENEGKEFFDKKKFKKCGICKP